MTFLSYKTLLLNSFLNGQKQILQLCVIFAFTHRTLKPKRAARGGKKAPGRFLCIVIYNSSLGLKQQLNHTAWTFFFHQASRQRHVSDEKAESGLHLGVDVHS